MSGAMRLALVVVTVVTLVGGRVLDEGPIVGPGPCSSETPWGCFAHQVWLPAVMNGQWSTVNG